MISASKKKKHASQEHSRVTELEQDPRDYRHSRNQSIGQTHSCAIDFTGVISHRNTERKGIDLFLAWSAREMFYFRRNVKVSLVCTRIRTKHWYENDERERERISLLDNNHFIIIDFHLDEYCVIFDVLERGQRIQIGKLLRTKTGITIGDRSTEKWFVLLARVGFDAVGNVTTVIDIFTLIQ